MKRYSWRIHAHYQTPASFLTSSQFFFYIAVVVAVVVAASLLFLHHIEFVLMCVSFRTYRRYIRQPNEVSMYFECSLYVVDCFLFLFSSSSSLVIFFGYSLLVLFIIFCSCWIWLVVYAFHGLRLTVNQTLRVSSSHSICMEFFR